MLELLSIYGADIGAAAVVSAIAAGAGVKIYRDKKKGVCTGCSGSCGSCSGCGKNSTPHGK